LKINFQHIVPVFEDQVSFPLFLDPVIILFNST